jgi:glycosyltransferase involved in cell wall biosynthesis
MKPTVTVCIPTYNRVDYLGAAIQSVLDQTYGGFQILITDNHSTDSTRELVASFSDPRIRYECWPRNIGMMGNFRSGIELAQTEYVAILPDDDLYAPDHLQHGLDLLAKYPAAIYYACPAYCFGAINGGYLRPRAITDVVSPVLFFEPKEAVRFLGVDNPGPLHIVCRRSAFRPDLFWGKGHFPPFDMLILTQLMAQGGFVFSNHSTSAFRIHANNTTQGGGDKQQIVRFNCMVWYAIRWLAQFLLDQYLCTHADIEHHGLTSPSPDHVVPLVIALGSFDSSPALQAAARRIFQARTDMDGLSARFRLARRIGFWALPISEKLSQLRTGWRP